MSTDNKLHIEVWSDVVCPFCFIGKKHYEEALAKFEHAGDVVLEWKSYQLDPEFVQPEERYDLEEGLAKNTTDLLKLFMLCNNRLPIQRKNQDSALTSAKQLLSILFRHTEYCIRQRKRTRRSGKRSLLLRLFRTGKRSWQH